MGAAFGTGQLNPGLLCFRTRLLSPPFSKRSSLCRTLGMLTTDARAEAVSSQAGGLARGLWTVRPAPQQICTRCSHVSGSQDVLSPLCDRREDIPEEPPKLVLRMKRLAKLSRKQGAGMGALEFTACCGLRVFALVAGGLEREGSVEACLP